MRFLALFAAAVSACAQSFPPLFDQHNAVDWILNTRLSQTYVDAAGDVYFAGNLPAGNSVPATFTLGAAGDWDIIVFKLNATMEQIRYITVIGGSGYDTLTGMQVDSEGHVFLSGTMHSADFPVTKRLPGTLDNYGGFMLKLSATGNNVEYSVLMPMESRALALGFDGGVYVGGFARSGQFQTTPAAYLSQPPSTNGNYGYVLKLRATDGEVEFATWLEHRVLNGMAPRRDGGVAITIDLALVALNSAGSRADFSAPLKSSTSLLTADPTGNLYVYEATSDFNTPISRLTKFSPQGAAVQSTDFGQPFVGAEIAANEDGTVYLSGAATASLPTRNSLEACYANRPGAQYASTNTGAALIAVNRTGEITYSGFTSASFQALAMAPGGRYLYGPADGVIRLDLFQIPTTPRLSPACLANGASYSSGPVTPGEIMTIYGSGIGPQPGLSFALVNGRVPTELAGISVTVDGVPAPVLYAQDAQINFIVPWSTRPVGNMEVCVTRAGDRRCMWSWGVPYDVAAFRDAQGPLVLLPDWTRTTRVPSGGYITLFVTGTGRMDGAVEDGGISGFPLSHVVNTGRALMSDIVPMCAPMGNCRTLPDAQIVYAGNSPGLVWGVTQINVKLPDLGSGTFRLTLSFPNSRTSPFVDLQMYRP